MSAEKPRRLGRGLEALLGSAQTTTPAAPGASPAPGSDLQQIPLARIRPNPFQPRREFRAEELADLESSIRASGLLQPVTVRRRGTDRYELVAGERRYRAVTNLGWTEIPAVVRDFDDQTMLVLALVENLQRSDLNAVEEARGYQRLIDEFKLTQQQVAEAVGKDRTTVTNLLRILTLPESVQKLVQDGQLSAGHARALLALEDRKAAIDLANEVIAQSLSVRETEQRVRATKAPSSATAPVPAIGSSPPAARRDPAVARIEDDLRSYLQTDVTLQLAGAEKGSLRINFYSNDDLERLLELILREKRRDF